jgi:predicted HTH domain antitoxin
MKTELVSVRLPKEYVLVIGEKAREDNTDKTTALKRILALGTKQYKLEKAVNKYKEGKASIGKAAEIAGISLWEMMDELKDKNISNPLTEEDYKDGIKNLKKVWG